MACGKQTLLYEHEFEETERSIPSFVHPVRMLPMELVPIFFCTDIAGVK